MVKLVIVVNFHEGRDKAETYRYWREVHAPIAAKTPGLSRYVQNHGDGARLVDNLAADGVAELWFEDQAAFDGAAASAEWGDMMEDAAGFVDFGRSVAVVSTEVVVV